MGLLHDLLRSLDLGNQISRIVLPRLALVAVDIANRDGLSVELESDALAEQDLGLLEEVSVSRVQSIVNPELLNIIGSKTNALWRFAPRGHWPLRIRSTAFLLLKSFRFGCSKNLLLSDGPRRLQEALTLLRHSLGVDVGHRRVGSDFQFLGITAHWFLLGIALITNLVFAVCDHVFRGSYQGLLRPPLSQSSN